MLAVLLLQCGSMMQYVIPVTQLIRGAAGKCAPEGRACWADAAWQVLPTVYRGIVQEGLAGADVPRDPAIQLRLRCAAAQETGH